MNSSADHLTRSKVLYHPTVVQKKRDEIQSCKEALVKKNSEKYQDALKVFATNVDCEKEIIKMLQKDLGSAIPLEQITLDMATISTFDKMLARYCATFIESEFRKMLICRNPTPNVYLEKMTLL